jgi:Fe-Mn family superoxide dismutase
MDSKKGECPEMTEDQTVVQEPLPFEETALEPHISARTLGFHYGKHHAAYVKNANGLLSGTDLAGRKPEEIIKIAAGSPDKVGIFNNVAQAWNHAFFWNCLKPGGGGEPAGKLADMIKSSFDGFAPFKEAFTKAATGQFGSGWAWLIVNDGKLEIVKTSNADTPVAVGKKPIFTIDVWEHAYYLDYQNKRPDFVKAVLDNLANWEFAASQI